MTLAVNNLCVLDNREHLNLSGFMNLRGFFHTLSNIIGVMKRDDVILLRVYVL
jgi:hypothetical protein